MRRENSTSVVLFSPSLVVLPPIIISSLTLQATVWCNKLALTSHSFSVFCALLSLPFPVLHSELLMSYCPLVERLGFDENFVDITEMVERRLVETLESKNFTSFKGHVYSHSSKSHLCLWCVLAVHLSHGN